MTNKEKARAYFGAVNAYDATAIERMVRPDYIQHNPHVPTGRAAFLRLIPRLKEHGTQIENVRMLADGPFVAMHHRWKNATPLGAERMVAFHVIRFDDSGLIAEHWSVMMEDALGSLADGETRIEELERTRENKERAIEWFRSLAMRSDLRYDRHHKVLGEGNFVLSISEGRHLDKPAALYDLLRFRDGMLLDRWRVVQEIPTANLANDNTMFNF